GGSVRVRDDRSGQGGQQARPVRHACRVDVMITRIVVGLVAVASLSACGSSGAASSDPIKASGCASARPTDTGELYTQHTYACADGTALYTFPSNTARDNWIRAAEMVGGAKIKHGDRWLIDPNP